MIKSQQLSWELNQTDLQLIDLALTEDLGLPYHDLTTQLLFPKSNKMECANIISKHPEPIIIAGLPVAKVLATKLDAHCEIHSSYQDGQILQPGETLLTLRGPAHTLLMIERTLLNFLQRLCAIATCTSAYVKLIRHTPTKILDTRKTLPGFRHLEKYAVFCGGGVNHRMGLYDAMMIKDTHIDLFGGHIKNVLDALPENMKQKFPVIIEVRTLDELEIVLENGLHKITRVLLDNMSITLLSQCVSRCKGVITTEASGNMNLHNILSVAECGVDYISVGKITHSATHVDLSMNASYQNRS